MGNRIRDIKWAAAGHSSSNAPEMERAPRDAEKAFESIVRLGSHYIPRTAHPDAWGGFWVHVFTLIDDDDARDSDRATWWSICTRANGSDTEPGWKDETTICPECMRLARF